MRDTAANRDVRRSSKSCTLWRSRTTSPPKVAARDFQSAPKPNPTLAVCLEANSLLHRRSNAACQHQARRHTHERRLTHLRCCPSSWRCPRATRVGASNKYTLSVPDASCSNASSEPCADSAPTMENSASMPHTPDVWISSIACAHSHARERSTPPSPSSMTGVAPYLGDLCARVHPMHVHVRR